MLRYEPYFRRGISMEASVSDDGAVYRNIVPHEVLVTDPPMYKYDGILHACMPSEAAKVVDVQHRMQRIKLGLSSQQVRFDAGELSRGLSKLETLFEVGSNSEVHSLQRELPCCSKNCSKQNYVNPDGSMFSMRRYCKYSALASWKSTEVGNQPIRTLFRARKWVDSEEQESQIVDNKLKRERIYSKYSSGRSERKGGRTCLQQNNDPYPKAPERLCPCFTKDKSRIMRTNMNVVGKEEVWFHKAKYKCDRADDGVHFKTQRSSCDPNKNKFTRNVTVASPGSHDSKVFRTIRAKKNNEKHFIDRNSSKCRYFKANHDNKRMVVQRVTMSVPFGSQTNLKNCVSIRESQALSGINCIPPQMDNRCTFLKEGNNCQWNEYIKPSETVVVLEPDGSSGREMLTPVKGKANIAECVMLNDLKHSVCKKVEQDCKEGKNHMEDLISVAHRNVMKSEKEKQETLEAETLVRANDILEKIANTLNQIKSLNQSSTQSAVDCDVEGLKGKFSSEESHNETREEIKIEFMKYGQNKEMKYNNLFHKPNKISNSFVESDKLIDEIWISDHIKESQENPLVKRGVFDGDQSQWIDKKDRSEMALSEVSKANASKTIPLKITDAISDFPLVENNTVCDIPNNLAFHQSLNHLDARRCHSVVAVINEKREMRNSSQKISTQFTSGGLKDAQISQRDEASVLLTASKLVDESSQQELIPRFILSCSSSSKGSSESNIHFSKNISKISGQESFPLDNLKSQILTSWSMVISAEKECSICLETGDEKIDQEKITASKSFECQPLKTSRLKKLSQPRIRCMKALRKELGDVLEKPVLERLNRMIIPQEKLQADSKVQSAERSKNQETSHKDDAPCGPCASLKKFNVRLQSPSRRMVEKKNPFHSVVASDASYSPFSTNSKCTSLMKGSQPVPSACPNELQKCKGVAGKLSVPAYRDRVDPPKLMIHMREKSANPPSKGHTSLLDGTPSKVPMDCFNVQKKKHGVELALDGLAPTKPLMMHTSPQNVNFISKKHTFSLCSLPDSNGFEFYTSNSLARNSLNEHLKEVSEVPLIISGALKNQIPENINDISPLENCKHPNQSCDEQGKNLFNAMKESSNQSNLYLCHLTAAKPPIVALRGRLSSQEVNLVSFSDVDSRAGDPPFPTIKGQSSCCESLKEKIMRMDFAAVDGDVDLIKVHGANGMPMEIFMYTKMPFVEKLHQKYKSVTSTEIDDDVHEECQLLTFPIVSYIGDQSCSGGRYGDPNIKFEELHSGPPPSVDGSISEFKIKRKRCKVIDRVANLDTLSTFSIPEFLTGYSSAMHSDFYLSNGGVAKLSLAEDRPSRDDTIVSCPGNKKRFQCYLKSCSEVRVGVNVIASPLIKVLSWTQSVGHWLGEPMLNAQSGTYSIPGNEGIEASVSGFIECDEYFLTTPGSFFDQSSLNDLMLADKSSLVVVWRNDFLMAEASRSYCSMDKGFQLKATSQDVYERMIVRNVWDRRRVVAVVYIALYLMVVSLVYLPSFYI